MTSTSTESRDWVPGTEIAAPATVRQRRVGAHLLRYVATWALGLGVLLSLGTALAFVGITHAASDRYVGALDASTARIAAATREYRAASTPAEKRDAKEQVEAATKRNADLRRSMPEPVVLDEAAPLVAAGALFLAFVLVRAWRPAVYSYGRGATP